MLPQRILITGGAGFVGSSLAIRFKQHFAGVHVTSLDNRMRRGSELNLPRLHSHGVEFVHGDVRCPDDLASLPKFDLLVDCAAEPSVQAGVGGSPKHVFDTNLTGTVICLEAARRWEAAFLFLSTSRVYPIAALNACPFREEETRFSWQESVGTPGFSPDGIAESFSLQGARSYYGASKLACELIIQEYVYNTGMPAIINRCGILAGPWQMGKVDQGVMTLWVAQHHFRRPLKYTGFGGHGKQLRDMLHVDDLFELLVRQIDQPSAWNGSVFNVGGGQPVSLSLRELTQHCRDATGNRLEITGITETSDVDLRIYLSDSRKAQRAFDWQPQRDPVDIIEDIHSWIVRESQCLQTALA